MRNLKRALSLVMASAMLIGMMVVGASAANFSDSEKIANTDAVTMVSELGIINGMPDGSYQPEANIDRASMAKMICVALNGGKDPQLGAGAVNSYTDTVGNWAAGYIEYCTSLGIVAGKGDKLFAPSANVTVSEAAKMLLVALGYNAETEGLVGATWQTKTDVLANQVGLYDGFISLTSANLTRDNAAQMVYNALNASVVKYDGGKAVAQTTSSYEWITSPDGKTTTAVTKEIEKTLLADKFKVTETTGIVMANEFGALAGTVQDEGVTVIGNTAYNLTTGLDLLGQKVTIYVRDTKTDGRANVTGGAVATDDCKVIVVTAKKTEAKLTELIEKDNKMKVDSATVYAANYDVTKNAIKANAAGQELRIIDNNNDGKVDFMIQTTFDLGKVTKYSTKDDGSITVKAGAKTYTKDDSDDVFGFEDVKKDDYVLAAEIGGKLYVEKAETVTGELTRVKSADGNATDLTVDGKVYKVSGVDFFSDGANLSAVNKLTNADSDTKATFYLDKAGNIVAMGEVEEGAANYAIVLGYVKGDDLSDARIKVLLSDGTTDTYNVDEIQTYNKGWDEDTQAEPQKGDLIAYTLDGNKITVRMAASDKLGKDEYAASKSAGAYKFTKGKTGLTLGTDNFYATSSTVFFYMNKSVPADATKGDIYTGYAAAPSPAKDASVEYRVVYELDNGDKIAKAVVVFNAGTASNGDYLYLYNGQGKDSKNSYFDAVINGELVKDIKVKGDKATGLYEYTINSDGVYEVGTAIDQTDGNYIFGDVERVSGNSVFVGGKEYVMGSATVSALIKGSDTALDETVEKGDTVILVVDDDDIETIFITKEAPEETEDKTTYTIAAPTAATGLSFELSAESAAAGTTITVTVKAATAGQVVKAADGQTPAATITPNTVTASAITINEGVATFTFEMPAANVTAIAVSNLVAGAAD